MLLVLLVIFMAPTASGDSVLTAPNNVLDGSISINCHAAAPRSSVGLGLECDLQSNANEIGQYCRGVLLGEHVSPALCYCADIPANGSTLTPLQSAHLYLRIPESFNKAPDIHWTLDALEQDWTFQDGTPVFAVGKVGKALDTATGGGAIGVMVKVPGTSVCYTDMTFCPRGVSVAMWLKIMIDPNTASTYVISATNCAFIRYQKAQLEVFARNTPDIWYRINVEYFLVNTWMHVMFTAKQGDGLCVYINGCDTGIEHINFTRIAPEMPAPLILGAGHTMLDELMYWYYVLEPMEIWRLYMQGGKVDQTTGQ